MASLGTTRPSTSTRPTSQFGPWSFGRFQSFFDFYADAFDNLGALGSDTTVNGVAYTFNAGNGFFATIALEDRGNIGYGNVATVPTAGGVGFTGSNLAAGTTALNNGGYRA